MPQPIRILHVLASMNRAGTESLLMSLYRNIDRNEIQFDFAVSAEEKCDFDDEIISLGGRIHHYPRYRGYNHLKYCAWWNSFFQNHKEYRIIHGHIGSTAAIYLSVANKYGLYSIAHSHNTNSTLSLHSFFYKMFSYPTRYTANYFFGCSRQALIDRYGDKVANSKKSAVLKNAIDVKKFIFDPMIREEVRKELNISENELIIGTVGRLSHQKNPEMIISIVKELVNRGEKFRFLWVGTGELEITIKDTISSMGLKDSYIFTGVREDINRILMAMDIFIFPSLWEGLGISCIEAQATGLPTLCSDVIPDEARVTDKISVFPVSDLYLWCSNIEKQITLINQNVQNRTNMFNQITDAGYDIANVAERLSRFYLKKIQGIN